MMYAERNIKKFTTGYNLERGKIALFFEICVAVRVVL
jgi:hypothetical protein